MGLPGQNYQGESPVINSNIIVFKNKLVYVLDKNIYASKDGIFWEQKTLCDLETNDSIINNAYGWNRKRILSYKNKMFLLTDQKCIYSSADGNTWNKLNSDFPGLNDSIQILWSFIVYNNKICIFQAFGPGWNFKVWESTNGRNWVSSIDTINSPFVPYPSIGGNDFTFTNFTDRIYALGGSEGRRFKDNNEVWYIDPNK